MSPGNLFEEFRLPEKNSRPSYYWFVHRYDIVSLKGIASLRFFLRSLIYCSDLGS